MSRTGGRARRAPRLAIEACRPVRRRTLGVRRPRAVRAHHGAHTNARNDRAGAGGDERRGRGVRGRPAGFPQGRGPASAERDATARHRAIDHRAICRFAGHIDLVVPVVVPRPRTMAAWAFLGAAPPPVERSKTTVRRAADVCRPGRRVARRRTRYTRAAEATPGTPGARGPG